MAPYWKFLSDPEVTVWLEDLCQRPVSLAAVQAFALHDAWCRWAIEVQGRFCGLTGLEEPDLARGCARFFIVIGDRTLWGRGIGQEVARQVLAHGFQQLSLRKIVSNYFVPNAAARALHARAGFRLEGCLRQQAWRRGAWVDEELCSIFASEFSCTESSRPADRKPLREAER